MNFRKKLFWSKAEKPIHRITILCGVAITSAILGYLFIWPYSHRVKEKGLASVEAELKIGAHDWMHFQQFDDPRHIHRFVDGINGYWGFAGKAQIGDGFQVFVGKANSGNGLPAWLYGPDGQITLHFDDGHNVLIFIAQEGRLLIIDGMRYRFSGGGDAMQKIMGLVDSNP